MSDATLRLVHPRCEREVDPLGLDEPRPRLSWRLETAREGARQTAYQIRVGSAKGGSNLWDSGRVDSDATDVRYGGAALSPETAAHWTVTAWDDAGNEAEAGGLWESGPAAWPEDWLQSTLAGGARTTVLVPLFRRDFALERPIAKARLYITALGVYEARINGERVGRDQLAPGWTEYPKRVRYQAHDVTDLLQEGSNCLGAILGDGWYAGHIGWRERGVYGDRPRLLAQLVVTHDDGSRTVVGTGEGWTTGFGSVLEADLLMGEAQDLRRESDGWDKAGFEGWSAAETVRPETTVVSQYGPPVRAIEEVRPVSLVERPGWPGSKWTFDLGQNIVGHVRLRLKGRAGSTVTLRYAERLKPDGTVYTENYRSARSTDYVTLTGGDDVFEPTLTFHGFQYVEISGFEGKLERDDLTGIVVHSAWEPTGEFECGDPLVQKLAENVRWGWKGNSLDVPTDCPQRDERLGWTGDAQVFVRTACFLGDVETFFEKYQQDLEDSQKPDGAIPPFAPDIQLVGHDGGPAWADAVVICPWTVYRHYGDATILERHFDSIRRWVESLEPASKDLIRSHPDLTTFAGFGDWLSTNAETPNDLIGTAFLVRSADLLVEICEVLGRDAAPYRDLAARGRRAFLNRFVTPDGLLTSGTQTAHVLALHFGLLPEAQRPAALQRLVDDIGRRGWKLSTGFVGTPYLLHVLTQGGRLDVAYRLLNQKAWPSWLYPVTQGATTIWERWDGWTEDKGFQDVGMNSFNHYAYGAVLDWLVAVVAGLDLDPAVPGYKRSRLAPRPGGGLPSAGARLMTRHGLLESRWTLADGRFEWHVTVPPNTTARAVLPPEAKADWTERDLAPGTYRFEAVWEG